MPETQPKLCPMCNKVRPVVESHLIPSALYDHTDDGNAGTIRVGDGVVIPGARELQWPLLCIGCEDILNKGGESWTCPLLAWWQERRFPLFDLALQCSRHVFDEGVIFYTASNPLIQVEKLTHFALGIFFRAAVHSWKKDKTEPLIDLGEFLEPIRLWLRGEGAFPENVAFHVSLSRPELAQIVHSIPVEISGHKRGPLRLYWLHLLGVSFSLSCGTLSEDEQATCFYTNPAHPLFLSDDVSKQIQLKYLREFMESRKTQAYLQSRVKRPGA